MVDTTHYELDGRIWEIVAETHPLNLMFGLRKVAGDALAQGYDRDALLEDFEGVRAQLDEAGDEDREDAVMEVMDFIYGWCSPHMKL